MSFIGYVNEHVAKRLSVEYLIDEISYGLLRDIVEECFLQEGYDDLSVQAKAEIILNELFAKLVRGFDFAAFLKKVPAVEQKAFLRELMYHILHRNLTLEHLVSSETLYCYLYRTLALTASVETIGAFYTKEALRFCLENFDEGAFRIIQYAGFKVEDEEKVKHVAAFFPGSNKAVDRFCSIFGLYDHQVPKEQWDLHDYRALDEKLAHVDKTSDFYKAVWRHIEALDKHPEYYLEGMKQITYALPTMGKDLSLLAWLPSIVASIQGFCKEFGIENTIPIFVFDQSEKPLFAKNAAYCQSLSPNIIHLDVDKVLELAKKLRIEKLLVTGPNGEFGYGGARNAIFLLMPLLGYRKSLDDITEQDFQDVVLDEKMGPNIIHMGDDDVYVPYSTAFSDALFAWEHKDEYFFRFGWMEGRRTTYTETTFNLDYLIERSSDILLQHEWKDEPFRHGMAGLLTKPKLCLNVPLGQEEAYLTAMKEYSFDLRAPMMHLSGYRLPAKEIPTNRLSYLAEHLRNHYRYIVGLMLVTDLLDPLDVFHRLALPWNKREVPFTSLRDAISYIVKPEVIAEMQTLFKQNMKNLKQGLENYRTRAQEKSDLALFHLSVLEVQDVDKVLEKYSRFPKEVAELKALFTDLVADYKAFYNALSDDTVQAPPNSIITPSFLLLKNNILNAAFQNAGSGLAFGHFGHLR